jgi:catechol 2,3-dioxygenase-like lactoylglutathione lyase family enzyme
MNRPVIGEIGHVAIVTTDLDAVVDNATTLMGMRVSERRDDGVDLTHGTPHHSLQYLLGDSSAVDHIGLVAPDSAALDEIRTRAEAAGARLLQDTPLDACLAEGSCSRSTAVCLRTSRSTRRPGSGRIASAT